MNYQNGKIIKIKLLAQYLYNIQFRFVHLFIRICIDVRDKKVSLKTKSSFCAKLSLHVMTTLGNLISDAVKKVLMTNKVIAITASQRMPGNMNVRESN